MRTVAARVPTTISVLGMVTATTIILAVALLGAQIVGQAGRELDANT